MANKKAQARYAVTGGREHAFHVQYNQITPEIDVSSAQDEPKDRRKAFAGCSWAEKYQTENAPPR